MQLPRPPFPIWAIVVVGAVVAVALVGLVFFMKRSVAAKDAHLAAE